MRAWEAERPSPLSCRQEGQLLKVGFDALCRLWKTHGGCRVVRDQVLPSPSMKRPPVEVSQVSFLFQNSLGRDLTQDPHDDRIDQGDLAFQPQTAAGIDLVLSGVSVSGRTTFDGAGDEDPVPLQTDPLQQLVQESPGAPAKRPSLPVLFLLESSPINSKTGVKERPTIHPPVPTGETTAPREGGST